MDPLPAFTVLEQSQVSPPPATICPQSLPLTFFDIKWLPPPNDEPVHTILFYELPITNTHFTETIVPNLKESLSITLQHFFPFVGKLTIFPCGTRIPEIRYVEGDSVAVTFAECNLDFTDLTGNHPRQCEKFYHLIPLLGRTAKVSDYITIPVFSVQVTLFPNYGISIGMTCHHALADGISAFGFLQAWTSIARSGGSDGPFLANGTLPVYDRLVKYPKLDASYLKNAKVETFNENYELPRLSGPTDKVRAMFTLTRTAIKGLKKLVSTELPTLPYVSSFTIACAYIWSCAVKLYNDEQAIFVFQVDCRSRLQPPVPEAYFGNCVRPCKTLARTTILKEKEGFLTACKMIGENLHNILTDKDGLMNDLEAIENIENSFSNSRPMKRIGVTGAPKFNVLTSILALGSPKSLKQFRSILTDRYLLVPAENATKIWRLVFVFRLLRWLNLLVISILVLNLAFRFVTLLVVDVLFNGWFTSIPQE